jgi:hypothetical protein
MMLSSVWSKNVVPIDPDGAGSCWHISSMSCSISGFAIPKQEREHKRWNEEQWHTRMNPEQAQTV